MMEMTTTNQKKKWKLGTSDVTVRYDRKMIEKKRQKKTTKITNKITEKNRTKNQTKNKQSNKQMIKSPQTSEIFPR